MVGPIWGNKIDRNKMGKPQSKVEIQENILNNGNAENKKLIIPEYITTLIIVVIILYLAYKVNKYFKNYVIKYRNRTNSITDV